MNYLYFKTKAGKLKIRVYYIHTFLFLDLVGPELYSYRVALIKGGGWSNLMSFELLTFPYREVIKLSIHI